MAFWKHRRKYQPKLTVEEQHQVAVAQYLQYKYPDVLSTISPEGMKLSYLQAVQFKLMGYRKGTPDIMIFKPVGQYHGLFIELKRPEVKSVNKELAQAKGRPTKEQEEFIDKLKKEGYYAQVCYGSRQAELLIDWYMNGG